MSVGHLRSLARQNTLYVGAALVAFAALMTALFLLSYLLPKGGFHDLVGFTLVFLAVFAPAALFPAAWVCLAAIVWATCSLIGAAKGKHRTEG
jgi:hypothetical protein